MADAVILALAVGKTRMGQDAVDLVQLLGTIQGENSPKFSIPTTKLTSDSEH